MQLRPATTDDFNGIIELLRISRLPAGDLNPGHAGAFLVLVDGAEIVACGALERFAEAGLLRSLCVKEIHRGDGVATQLVIALENGARFRGVRQVFLLATTATGLFDRLGYSPCDRNSAPPSVAATAPFKTLCPSDSTCMVKRLTLPR